MKIASAVRAVLEPEKIIKKIKIGQQCYISRVCGGGTPIVGMMKLGTLVDVLDVMNYDNFHLRVICSLGARGGSKNRFCL
jgi:hypothetical protein